MLGSVQFAIVHAQSSLSRRHGSALGPVGTMSWCGCCSRQTSAVRPAKTGSQLAAQQSQYGTPVAGAQGSAQRDAQASGAMHRRDDSHAMQGTASINNVQMAENSSLGRDGKADHKSDRDSPAPSSHLRVPGTPKTPKTPGTPPTEVLIRPSSTGRVMDIRLQTPPRRSENKGEFKAGEASSVKTVTKVAIGRNDKG